MVAYRKVCQPFKAHNSQECRCTISGQGSHFQVILGCKIHRELWNFLTFSVMKHQVLHFPVHNLLQLSDEVLDGNLGIQSQKNSINDFSTFTPFILQYMYVIVENVCDTKVKKKVESPCLKKNIALNTRHRCKSDRFCSK